MMTNVVPIARARIGAASLAIPTKFLRVKNRGLSSPRIRQRMIKEMRGAHGPSRFLNRRRFSESRRDAVNEVTLVSAGVVPCDADMKTHPS
jgi:hypothetical protein